jgi:hypothetical protein
LLSLDGDPAGEIVGRLHRHLAPNQLAKLPLQVFRCEPIEHAPALASTIQRHHQAGLLPCAPEANNPEAEGAMPTPCCALSDLDMLHLGLPDQGAIGKKPRVLSTGT